MIVRRDVLMGGICLIGAGASYALVPRRHVALLGRYHMEAIVPRVVGDWSSRDVSDLVAPKIEGSLMSRLYGETVGRVYRQSSTGAEVMMLLAYGDTQSDDLQLHRPEICYPAFGYAISANRPAIIPLVGDHGIPARSLVADAPDRRETILYWSRLGEFLPLDRHEQQLDRTRTAMNGVIADGLLARFSVAGGEPAPALATMQAFVPALVRSVAAIHRAALIGSSLAAEMSAAGG